MAKEERSIKTKVKKTYSEMKEINEIQSHYNNTRGLLISHNLKRERGSKKEVNDLLDRFLVEDENKNFEDNTIRHEEKDDVDQQLAKELEALKKKNFIYETGVECMLYCEVPYDAIQVVSQLFDGAKKERIVMKETQKIVPLQKVDMASSMEKLLKSVKELLNEVHRENYNTFAISYNCRHNSNYSRDIVIKNVADLMPKEWKVNLKDPDVTVMIEIFYRGFGVSFVEREVMKKYNHFNIQRYIQSE
ncbi:hypothetical protein, conserved [Entamoeba dispar SAW760]|uniref:THUMP domain-containing protein n=1 Tax=Entamoeba dispar (strain ATCC PRA-260 / SAW760) TaxID=370354 RepID=B0EAU5_ENTDS|nr:uncharacterized protein EDI_102200 [Entamoeba dispar SAW760]EDR28355.1 hypothetical protein, conserved [Entamoeba dispar SAW760]|eukprot:EDR28355.1 hypothetical protein, conserved [Entamoeba dispar SAW760]